MWGTIGVLLLFLIIGFVDGIIRGLKRSSLHILFLIASIVLAFFITKPVTESILGCKITADGVDYTISEYIVEQIKTNFDISNFETANEFLLKIPNAIVSPILFIVLTFLSFIVFDIIYLIVARISFGSKKKDFAESKPYRAYGGVVGVVEAFLFLFVLFAPLSSLTKTYAELATLPQSSQEVVVEEENSSDTSNKKKTIAETLNDVVPKNINEAILAYNDSVIGKIAGAGGLDNALFDYLSNFELEGEKIEFRTEIISMADIYDDSVVVYNFVVDKNYLGIDLTQLKESLSIFMDKGVFKTVVADTVKDFVLKFDDVKNDLNLNLPEVVENAVKELQTKFSEENFDVYNYLKDDVLGIVDALADLFKSDILTDFEKLDSPTLTDVLNVVNQNDDAVKNVLTKFLNLNLVKDTFNSIGEFASEKLAGMFDDTKGLEIALNTNIEDKDQMVEDLIDIVNKVVELDKKISISDLLQSSDIVETLTNIDDLADVLTQVGETFDTVRNFELFVLPKTETRAEKVYVFDNILKIYDVELLNDEVYLTASSKTKTKLDSYTLFFEYIKTPIVTAKELGLTDAGKEGSDFDTILDKLLVALKTKEDLLSDILLPFYQLSAMDLKTLVFDKIVDELGTNTNNMLNFTSVKDEAASDTTQGGVGVWNREFTLIGKTLNALNKGSVTVGDTTKTYLKAMLDSTAKYDDILKAMINSGTDFETAFDPIFTATSFEGLTEKVFENIDSSVGDITGITPQTSITNLKDTKDNTILTIKTLLTITLNNTGDLTLTQMGQMLDALKTNAYNGGDKEGVFNEIFANIIWYMTGDDITGTGKFASGTPNDNAKDVKAFLNVDSANNYVGYYTFASYEEKMTELQETIDFATNLSNKLNGIVLADETISSYVSAFKESLDEMTEKTEAEKIEIINNLTDLISRNSDRKAILSDSDKTTYGDKIVAVIDSTDSGLSANLGTALKNLLGLGQ